MSTSWSDYDPASLASAMVEASSTKMSTLLAAKVSKYSSIVDGYSSLSSYLSDFQDLLEKYTETDPESSISAQTCTASDTDYFTVTSDGTAANGNYQIYVEQLATAEQTAMSFSSSSETLPTTGTLALSVGTSSMTIDFSTLSSGATLQSLVSAINNDDDNPGVTASLVQSGDTVYLMLSSDDTGADNAFTATYSDGDSSDSTSTFETAFNDQIELSTGQDATIQLGSSSNAISITSDSNTVDDALSGLTLTLTKAQTDSSPINLTVAVDTSTVETNLQSFADSFNELITNLKDLYDSGGDLESDSTVTSIISSLKNTLKNSLPSGTSLNDLGLEFNSSGSLTINTTLLESALKSNPDILNSCLIDDGGAFDSLDTMLKTFTKTNGIIDQEEESAQDSLDRATDKQDNWNTKMDSLYSHYLSQFTQMQVTLEELESSMDYLDT